MLVTDRGHGECRRCLSFFRRPSFTHRSGQNDRALRQKDDRAGVHSAMVVFESAYLYLLFFHALASVVLCGGLAHLVWRLVEYFCGRRSQLLLPRLHASIVSVSYVIVYILGALVYPPFRINVRHEYLDKTLPWATGLFEAKEHLASLGVVAVFALAALLWTLPDEPDRSHRRMLPLVAGLTVFVAGVVGFSAWAGWLLNTLKGI